MSQIRDKKAHRKHIATMNSINAKSVQLIELHAFAYCLLSVSLSESFDFFKSNLKRMIIQIYFGNCAVLQYTLHFREGMLIERSLSFSANAVR